MSRSRRQPPHGRAVPILQQGAALIASVQDALSDAELLQLRDDLVRAVGEQRACGVVIDVTALDVMDSFACATLRRIAAAIELRGAHTVVVGIQPEVAFAMVQLGLTLEGSRTALDLADGLAVLEREAGDRFAGR